MDQVNVEQPQGEWVLLEIFGHRQHWGYLTEVERFGSKLARIDEFRPGDEAPIATHYYGGGSIFSVTPVTEDTARKRVAYERPAPAVQSLLPPPDPFADDDDDDIASLADDPVWAARGSI